MPHAGHRRLNLYFTLPHLLEQRPELILVHENYNNRPLQFPSKRVKILHGGLKYYELHANFGAFSLLSRPRDIPQNRRSDEPDNKSRNSNRRRHFDRTERNQPVSRSGGSEVSSPSHEVGQYQ